MCSQACTTPFIYSTTSSAIRVIKCMPRSTSIRKKVIVLSLDIIGARLKLNPAFPNVYPINTTGVISTDPADKRLPNMIFK